MKQILYERLEESKGMTEQVNDVIDSHIVNQMDSPGFLLLKDQPEQYLIFEDDGNSKELTYNQIIQLIFADVIQHHTTIKKVSTDCWTKAGILMEFREALKIQIKNSY